MCRPISENESGRQILARHGPLRSNVCMVRFAMRHREPELEEEAIEIARQLGRDRDPIYWRRRYFDLLALNARRGRDRDMWQGMALVCLLVGGSLFLLKWLLHW